uniref:Techylectin-5A n=2 Tax=Tachypleus tridentatus TaxID=6853 RepID=TL5A_TACTR|nr:RecName: Full=Techylectin-5A; Flags: Precursor [Tachypleus tridentatus]BAA84188.1 techylectin-5A [Tachypleus tridentatus]
MHNLRNILFVITLIGQKYGLTSSQNKELCDVTSSTGLLDSIKVMASHVKEQLKDKGTSEVAQPIVSPDPTDCADILLNGYRSSGGYRIWPKSWMTVGTLNVYCDMETDGGGWTVIQRRGNYGNPSDYFYKPWKNYKLGFGNIEKDFWLGNDRIFALTNQRNYMIRFDLKDKENDTRYAIYQDFWIENEDYLYCLHIGNYSGDAGNSFGRHNGHNFSTIDKDHDTHETHCAQTYKGGWWYDRCHESNLNGLYLNGEHNSYADGIEWRAWKGYHYSLPQVEMKIRPVEFNIIGN